MCVESPSVFTSWNILSFPPCLADLSRRPGQIRSMNPSHHSQASPVDPSRYSSTDTVKLRPWLWFRVNMSLTLLVWSVNASVAWWDPVTQSVTGQTGHMWRCWSGCWTQIRRDFCFLDDCDQKPAAVVSHSHRVQQISWYQTLHDWFPVIGWVQWSVNAPSLPHTVSQL